MRPYVLKLHSSAKSIHAAAGHIPDRPDLDLIRSVGAWAFVSVPPNEDLDCIVHMWHRRGCRPELIARVLGHELGHIADAGPKDSEIGRIPEEERADEFAFVTTEVVGFLLGEGAVRRRAGRGGRRPGPRSRRR